MKLFDQPWFWLALVILLLSLAVGVSLFVVTANLQPGTPVVRVEPTPALKPVFTPTRALTITPAITAPVPTAGATRSPATAAPVQTQVSAPCKNNAALIKHVTAPDGSSIPLNQGFAKTWQVQNTGTCAWSTRYQLVHVQGERMTAIGIVAVPANVPPGQTVDLTVALTAPGMLGARAGQWQLRDETGALFGPLLPVSINVVAPSPTPCVPQIASFTADRAALTRGESTVLRWGAITNAQRIEIDNGVGVVTAPGNRTVAPAQTTTFTLAVTCGTSRATKSVTITVNQPVAPTAPPATRAATPQQPGQRTLTGIWSGGKYILQLETGNCAGAECVVQGEFSEWSGTALPVPGLATGTFNPTTGAVALKITAMPVPDKTFTGTVDASNTKLAGQLSGVGAITFTKQ